MTPVDLEQRREKMDYAYFETALRGLFSILHTTTCGGTTGEVLTALGAACSDWHPDGVWTTAYALCTALCEDLDIEGLYGDPLPDGLLFDPPHTDPIFDADQYPRRRRAALAYLLAYLRKAYDESMILTDNFARDVLCGLAELHRACCKQTHPLG